MYGFLFEVFAFFLREFASGMVGMVELDKMLKFLNSFEDSPKPVVAAMHGFAVGGGCVFSLACHYRIGTAKSKYGLPEINLGVLPCGGGTWRTPNPIRLSFHYPS